MNTPQPTLTPGPLQTRSPLRRKPTRDDLAFYLLMGSLALGLLYFLLLPIFI